MEDEQVKQQQQDEPGAERRETLRDRLARKIEEMGDVESDRGASGHRDSDMGRAEELLTWMDANPEMARVFDLMADV